MVMIYLGCDAAYLGLLAALWTMVFFTERWDQFLQCLWSLTLQRGGTSSLVLMVPGLTERLDQFLQC